MTLASKDFPCRTCLYRFYFFTIIMCHPQSLTLAKAIFKSSNP